VEDQTTAPPDPAALVFAVPREAVVADDLRATLLDFWIHRARLAGHVIAEYLRSGAPESDPTGARHCGTARLGTEAFDVYVSDSLNQVYAVRVGGSATRKLLGLDPAPTLDELRARKLAGDTAELRGTVEGQARGEEDRENWVINGLVEQLAPPATERENWVTRTAAELIELVERANNLLRTDVGNDVERDAVRDQADMLGIIATLLPAWADRGLHADTENNIDMAAARLTHLLDELES
jgi:hypothetical protein